MLGTQHEHEVVVAAFELIEQLNIDAYYARVVSVTEGIVYIGTFDDKDNDYLIHVYTNLIEIY